MKREDIARDPGIVKSGPTVIPGSLLVGGFAEVLPSVLHRWALEILGDEVTHVITLAGKQDGAKVEEWIDLGGGSEGMFAPLETIVAAGLQFMSEKIREHGHAVGLRIVEGIEKRKETGNVSKEDVAKEGESRVEVEGKAKGAETSAESGGAAGGGSDAGESSGAGGRGDSGLGGVSEDPILVTEDRALHGSGQVDAADERVLRDVAQDHGVQIKSVEEFQALASAAHAVHDYFGELCRRILTPERMAIVRQLRVDEGRSWRSVAAQCYERWGEETADETWDRVPSNQLMGVALCEASAAHFDEDYMKPPWNG
jgi:hypothetical protein